MRRWLDLSVAMAVLVALLALAGCKKEPNKNNPTPDPTQKPATSTELNLLIFSEYIDEKIVSDFEKQEGIRLRITTYESTDEMEGKLSYGGADSQYDVVVAASHAMPRMARRGLVRPLDHAKIPNLKNLDPKFSGASFDDGNKHGVPYQWGTVGLMYNKKKHPSLEPSWSVIFDPKKVPGPFVLLDEMRDMLGSVLKYKGYSDNTTTADEIRAAGRVLQDAKSHPKCLGFKGGVGAIQDVKAGSADLAIVWAGDALREMEAEGTEKDHFAYVVPQEGSVMWIDAMMVTQRAPNPDMAHKFINFILDPEIGARLSAFTRYATPNAAAKARVPPEDVKNPAIYPPPELLARLEHHRDLGEVIKIFDEVWTSVKSR